MEQLGRLADERPGDPAPSPGSSGVDASEGDESPLFARAVGSRLRQVRHQRGLSLLRVEAETGREFKASVLGAYERGERVISILRLQRLAEVYRVPVDDLLPRPAGGAGPGAPTGEDAGRESLRIDLGRLEQSAAPERDAIARYVRRIQWQRSDVIATTVALRSEDLRALGHFFERDEYQMRSRLREIGVTG